jgi:hypothetical protein
MKLRLNLQLDDRVLFRLLAALAVLLAEWLSRK